MSSTLRMQKSWTIEVEGETLELKSAIQNRRIALRWPVDLGLGLLSLLSNGVDPIYGAEIISREFGVGIDEAITLLEKLRSLGVLVLSNDSEEIEVPSRTAALFDRQIRYLSLFENESYSGREFNQRLQSSTVLVVGVGGIGSWLALTLARLGLKRLVLIDSDYVELSNLPRQILFDEDDIGESKVVAAKRALASTPGDLIVDAHNLWISEARDLVPFLDGVDLVINPFAYLADGYAESNGQTAKAIAEACLQTATPSLLCGAMVGPITLPGSTACISCVEVDQVIGPLVVARTPFARETVQPAFAPRLSLMAGFAAWEATRFLSGMDRAPTLDGLLSIDCMSYSRHGFFPVKRNTSCPMCGDN